MASARFFDDPKEIGELIQKIIHSNNRVWINDSQANKRISFKTVIEAQQFVLLLDKLSICSHKFPGKSKTIQSEDPYFVIFLTANEMTTLIKYIHSLNISQPAQSSPAQAGKFKSKPTSKYSEQQQNVFDFASNCCAFPAMVVAINDQYGFDPHTISGAINFLGKGNEPDVDKLVLYLQQKQKHKP
jgi:hypothetical protein